jgi:hypothetical protein
MPLAFRAPKPSSWLALHRWLLEFQRIGKPIGDYRKVLPKWETLRWAWRDGFEQDAVVREFNRDQFVLLGEWIIAVRRMAIRRERPDILSRLQEEVFRATSGICDEGILHMLQPAFFLAEPLTERPRVWPGSVEPKARAHAFMKRLQHLVAFWMLEADRKDSELPVHDYKMVDYLWETYGASRQRLRFAAEKGYIRSRKKKSGARVRLSYSETDVAAYLGQEKGGEKAAQTRKGR